MLKKRSFSLSRHRTSVALEPEFWAVLEGEAVRAGKSLAAVVTEIDKKRGMRPLASALRLTALAAASLRA
jgi:predicted DNA-binding ribbon-helix-helix protein